MKKNGCGPGAAGQAAGEAGQAAKMQVAQAGSAREGGPPEKKARKLGGSVPSDAVEPKPLGTFARKVRAKSDPKSPKVKGRSGGGKKKAIPPVGSDEHNAALAKKKAQKRLAAIFKQAADHQLSLRAMQSAIASMQDSIDNQKEYKYI